MSTRADQTHRTGHARHSQAHFCASGRKPRHDPGRHISKGVQGFKGARGSKSESAPEQARPPETVSVPCVHTISSDNSAKAVIIHQSGFDPPIYIEIYIKWGRVGPKNFESDQSDPDPPNPY